MTGTKPRRPTCKDCGALVRNVDGAGGGRVRKPGPRCASCWRAEQERRKEARHERDMGSEFGLEPGEYQKLYDAQGGRCALCGIARGLTKRLPVDHDHHAPCCGVDHPADKGCRRCVRGLACVDCNDYLGRRAHDDPQVFARGYWYLIDPPARRVLVPE